MKALSPVDQLFLWLEKRQQPMHVGGLQLFSFPEGAGPKYVSELAQQMRDYCHPVAPFNQRLTRRLGQYYWTRDKQFDIDHHFRHEALPKPGRIRELLSLVSAEHSNLLDRERPMWEAHLIEGIRGRQFALYYKIHHSVMDGISAMRIASKTLSTDPSEREMAPAWAFNTKKRSRSLPSNPVDMASSMARLTASISKQAATVPGLAREVYKVTQKAKKDENYVSIFQAPDTILNNTITGSRRFAAQSFPLPRLKVIAKAYNCTINTVVLSMCGHALREYLISQHALPDEPLIAMVPMSLRQDDSTGGNQIGMILANLGTHICASSTIPSRKPNPASRR
jgi:diacylglycerol O-acyltransferase